MRIEEPPARRRRGRAIRLITGWGLTLAGLILGPVPVLPGFVFLVPGIAILCAESRFLRALIKRYREKKIMKQALREAARMGIAINLEYDPEVDGEEKTSNDSGKGSVR